VLNGKISWRDAVARIEPYELSVMPAGSRPYRASDLTVVESQIFFSKCVMNSIA
jgi:hypothetical protein